MCLVKMKVEHEDETPPPARRIIVRPVSSERIIATSRPVSRHSQRSHLSTHRLSTTVLEPRRSSHYAVGPVTSTMTRTTTGRASIPRIIQAPTPPRSRERLDLYVTDGGSPRGSRTSVRGRHGPRDLDKDVLYVERRRSTRDRPRSAHYLSPASAAEVVEAPRQLLYLDDGSVARSRSITYGTTGLRASRERVVHEDGGRRRESYRTLGSY